MAAVSTAGFDLEELPPESRHDADILVLSRCLLRSAPSLTSYSCLRSLDLSHNDLHHLTLQSLTLGPEDLPSIWHVDLSHCRLAAPPPLFPNHVLGSLNLVGNSFNVSSFAAAVSGVVSIGRLACDPAISASVAIDLIPTLFVYNGHFLDDSFRSDAATRRPLPLTLALRQRLAATQTRLEKAAARARRDGADAASNRARAAQRSPQVAPLIILQHALAMTSMALADITDAVGGTPRAPTATLASDTRRLRWVTDDAAYAAADAAAVAAVMAAISAAGHTTPDGTLTSGGSGPSGASAASESSRTPLTDALHTARHEAPHESLAFMAPAVGAPHYGGPGGRRFAHAGADGRVVSALLAGWPVGWLAPPPSAAVSAAGRARRHHRAAAAAASSSPLPLSPVASPAVASPPSGFPSASAGGPTQRAARSSATVSRQPGGPGDAQSDARRLSLPPQESADAAVSGAALAVRTAAGAMRGRGGSVGDDDDAFPVIGATGIVLPFDAPPRMSSSDDDRDPGVDVYADAVVAARLASPASSGCTALNSAVGERDAATVGSDDAHAGRANTVGWAPYPPIPTAVSASVIAFALAAPLSASVAAARAAAVAMATRVGALADDDGPQGIPDSLGDNVVIAASGGGSRAGVTNEPAPGPGNHGADRCTQHPIGAVLLALESATGNKRHRASGTAALCRGASRALQSLLSVHAIYGMAPHALVVGASTALRPLAEPTQQWTHSSVVCAQLFALASPAEAAGVLAALSHLPVRAATGPLQPPPLALPRHVAAAGHSIAALFGLDAPHAARAALRAALDPQLGAAAGPDPQRGHAVATLLQWLVASARPQVPDEFIDPTLLRAWSGAPSEQGGAAQPSTHHAAAPVLCVTSDDADVALAAAAAAVAKAAALIGAAADQATHRLVLPQAAISDVAAAAAPPPRAPPVAAGAAPAARSLVLSAAPQHTVCLATRTAPTEPSAAAPLSRAAATAVGAHRAGALDVVMTLAAAQAAASAAHGDAPHARATTADGRAAAVAARASRAVGVGLPPTAAPAAAAGGTTGHPRASAVAVPVGAYKATRVSRDDAAALAGDPGDSSHYVSDRVAAFDGVVTGEAVGTGGPRPAVTVGASSGARPAESIGRGVRIGDMVALSHARSATHAVIALLAPSGVTHSHTGMAVMVAIAQSKDVPAGTAGKGGPGGTGGADAIAPLRAARARTWAGSAVGKRSSIVAIQAAAVSEANAILTGRGGAQRAASPYEVPPAAREHEPDAASGTAGGGGDREPADGPQVVSAPRLRTGDRSPAGARHAPTTGEDDDAVDAAILAAAAALPFSVDLQSEWLMADASILHRRAPREWVVRQPVPTRAAPPAARGFDTIAAAAAVDPFGVRGAGAGAHVAPDRDRTAVAPSAPTAAQQPPTYPNQSVQWRALPNGPPGRGAPQMTILQPPVPMASASLAAPAAPPAGKVSAVVVGADAPPHPVPHRAGLPLVHDALLPTVARMAGPRTDPTGRSFHFGKGLPSTPPAITGRVMPALRTASFPTSPPMAPTGAHSVAVPDKESLIPRPNIAGAEPDAVGAPFEATAGAAAGVVSMVPPRTLRLIADRGMLRPLLEAASRAVVPPYIENPGSSRPPQPTEGVSASESEPIDIQWALSLGTSGTASMQSALQRRYRGRMADVASNVSFFPYGDMLPTDRVAFITLTNGTAPLVQPEVPSIPRGKGSLLPLPGRQPRAVPQPITV